MPMMSSGPVEDSVKAAAVDLRNRKLRPVVLMGAVAVASGRLVVLCRSLSVAGSEPGGSTRSGRGLSN